MSSSAMQDALAQMQSMASQASMTPEKGQQVSTAVGDTGFADELQSSIERINELKQASKSQERAFQAGDPDVALNDVMIDKQKASVAFEMGVQVRNRLVTAYKDIMNMQV
ncbi:flagellar hook-basal body complex protein FliE [Aidingimonas halophila]|uniref:Flagellar hook-basal body complex protein FliE n=1 Tax=Aidingimonas halophila TaxID=574349 RepID=A0A1H3B9Z8_9GAMM|nr:flagellar hook-basal body complex protein FliE [Aidingimonas halophila]GHC26178.1 flagellar hook-basal body complex protein FliE [Aidingimonas halophila]SDX38850.1 flagellar hook-basal body complex protein FliE [Aidingimonas halophila]